jgi:hypothetical protein
MVSAVTNMTPDAIFWDLSLARGLQYQAIWLELQGNVTEPASAGIDTVTKWKEIAGK